MVQWLDSKWRIGEVGPVGADVVVHDCFDVSVVADDPSTPWAEEEEFATGVAVCAVGQLV